MFIQQLFTFAVKSKEHFGLTSCLFSNAGNRTPTHLDQKLNVFIRDVTRIYDVIFRQRTALTLYVLLTVNSGLILVNNQSDARFFMYVYFYSLHVSGSHVPIIRRIVVSVRHLVYVTLCRLPSGMQEHMLHMHTICGHQCLVYSSYILAKLLSAMRLHKT